MDKKLSTHYKKKRGKCHDNCNIRQTVCGEAIKEYIRIIVRTQMLTNVDKCL